MKLVLEIKVIPRSSKHELVETGAAIKAYLKSAPDKGKANKELIELLAEVYRTGKGDIRIIAGKTARKKIVEVIKK